MEENRGVEIEELISRAREAAEYSYSPYSRFPVGAALLCKNGTVFTGANIENRSFGLTNCAERSALFAALSAGIHDFEALAVAAPASDVPIPPCGACRQVLSEFVKSDFKIYFAGISLEYVAVTMKELLPHDSLHDLKNPR